MDIVYLITDTVTGLKYIGSKKDWQGPGTYFGSPSCKSPVFKKYALQQEWKKAVKERPETFELTILESFDSIPHKNLFEKEREWQVKYNVNKSTEFINIKLATKSTLGNLYEDLDDEESDALKKRVSDGVNKTLNKMAPEERKEKWSRPGESNPNYGNKWSDEKKKKSSEIVKQEYASGKRKKYKLGKTNKELFGEEKAEEMSKRLSDIASKRVGDKNTFFGKKHSEETKEKLRKINLGKKPTNTKIVIIDGIKYEGLTEASKTTGIKPTTIWYRIKSKNPKYKEYKYEKKQKHK